MRILRPLVLVPFLAFAACGDSPTDPDPDPERGLDQPGLVAVTATELEAALEEWVRRAPLEVAAGYFAWPRWNRSGKSPALTAARTALFLAPSGFDAQAITAAGACKAIDYGYFKRGLALTAANVTDMAADIAAGNPVNARSFTFHSRTNGGTSGFAERTRVAHWSAASGALTLVGTHSAMEAPMVAINGGVEASIPVTTVAGWAAGDSVFVEQFGVVAAAESAPCSPPDHATFWTQSAGAQLTF